MGWKLGPYYLVGLEAWFRNSGTPAGFKPKGSRFRSRTWCRTAASKPLNAKQNLYGVDRVCGLATSWQAEVDLAPCTGWLKMRCCHWNWPATVALELAGKQSMLHASLAPPPQARQRGRRILCALRNSYTDWIQTCLWDVLLVTFWLSLIRLALGQTGFNQFGWNSIC